MLSSQRLFLRPIKPLQLHRSFASTGVIHLSDLPAVEKFTSASDTAILYYTARWCPPCQTIKPIYEKLSTSVALGMIDVDDNPDAAGEAEISSVPTFISYHKGQVAERFAGADVEQLKRMVETLESK